MINNLMSVMRELKLKGDHHIQKFQNELLDCDTETERQELVNKYEMQLAREKEQNSPKKPNVKCCVVGDTTNMPPEVKDMLDKLSEIFGSANVISEDELSDEQKEMVEGIKEQLEDGHVLSNRKVKLNKIGPKVLNDVSSIGIKYDVDPMEMAILMAQGIKAAHIGKTIMNADGLFSAITSSPSFLANVNHEIGELGAILAKVCIETIQEETGVSDMQHIAAVMSCAYSEVLNLAMKKAGK